MCSWDPHLLPTQDVFLGTDDEADSEREEGDPPPGGEAGPSVAR